VVFDVNGPSVAQCTRLSGRLLTSTLPSKALALVVDDILNEANTGTDGETLQVINRDWRILILDLTRDGWDDDSFRSSK
jgi:hypothetical protein